MSDDATSTSVTDAAETCRAVMERIESAAVIDRPVVETILTAVVARGHVLLEDVPGTGKTVTARLLAEALGLDFSRIQFTPDLLPSDITGSNVYNEHEGRFEFSEGPVFTNVVLADEINRAPPKTQAALLESMEERQVSVDGETHDLPEPFFVIATQNPVEQEGTFRLPEAQRDRFIVKTSLGYADVEGEMALLERRANRRTLAPSVEPVADAETVRAIQATAEEVRVDEKVRRYIVALARATREDTRTEIGVSPRGIQRVFEAARARAVIAGREYVTPDDVKAVAEPAMVHRLILTTEASVEGVDARAVVRRALDVVDVPAVSPESDGSEGAAYEPASGPRSPDPPGQPGEGPPDQGPPNSGQPQGRQRDHQHGQGQPGSQQGQGRSEPRRGQGRTDQRPGGRSDSRRGGGQSGPRGDGQPDAPRDSRPDQPRDGTRAPSERRPADADPERRPDGRDPRPDRSDAETED